MRWANLYFFLMSRLLLNEKLKLVDFYAIIKTNNNNVSSNRLCISTLVTEIIGQGRGCGRPVIFSH